MKARLKKLFPILGLYQDVKLLQQYSLNWWQSFKQDSSIPLSQIITAVKLYHPWRSYLHEHHTPLVDKLPMLVFEANHFLEQILTPETIVFEYGSGGSTLFYANRVRHVTSVEHDLEWFRCVQQVLQTSNLHNCDHYWIAPETPEYLEKGVVFDDPTAYRSSRPRHRNDTFYAYVRLIDAFPDNSFDLVAVDGRARPSCVLHARSKVKPGGYLMLDNSNRPHYQQVRHLMSDWESSTFFGPERYSRKFWYTTFWRKGVTHCSKAEAS